MAKPVEHLERLSEQRVAVMATVHGDGRPHLSLVQQHCHDGVIDVSLTERRVKARNLRADPRAAIMIAFDDDQRFVVAEGGVELSTVSTVPGDPTGRRLRDLYRALAGEHPDWADYDRAMVADRRLVARLTVARTYAGGAHT